jgi:hypothetical protein
MISQTLLKKISGGRTAAWEIMVGTPAIRNLIRENKVAQMYSAIQTGQAVGMQTLDQNLKDMVKKGLITRIDAKSKAQNSEGGQKNTLRHGVPTPVTLSLASTYREEHPRKAQEGAAHAARAASLPLRQASSAAR